MADRFKSVLLSMRKEDGSPKMNSWSVPAVATILVENGWPLSEVARQAWSQAYDIWNDFISSKPPEVSQIIIGPRGERTAVQKDGSRRPALNIEMVASPENQWLYEDALFSDKVLSALGIGAPPPTPKAQKTRKP